jgi:hypothetical protein
LMPGTLSNEPLFDHVKGSDSLECYGCRFHLWFDIE